MRVKALTWDLCKGRSSYERRGVGRKSAFRRGEV